MRPAPALAAALLAVVATPDLARAAPFTLQAALSPPAGLTVSGTARARYESLGGQLRPGFGVGEDMVVLRSTLFAEYRRGPLRVGGELWDSRAYGVERRTVLSTTDVNAFEPQQAYVGLDLGPVLGAGSKLDLQAGRMLLNLGSRRLVAADDFRNTASGFTGVKLDGRLAGGWSASLVYVSPQGRLPDDLASLRDNHVRLDDDDAGQRLWGGVAARTTKTAGTFEASYFGFKEQDRPGRPTRDRRLTSLGARWVRAPAAGKLDWELETIVQSGRIRASTAAAAPILDVSAGFAHAEAGWTFRGSWKPHLAVEYDYAGGDHGAGRYNRFDTLFGFRRGDFAPSGILSAIGRANISAPGARLEIEPSPRLDAMLHVQPMWLASARDSFATTGVRDASGRAGRYAGTLVDARLRWWVRPKSLRFEFNGDWIDKGRFLRTAPNAPATGDVLYGAASLTASF